MAKITNNILLAVIVALLTWSWVSYITNWQLIAVLASIAVTALFLVLASKNNITTTSQKLTDSLAVHLSIDSNSLQLMDKMLQYYLYATTIIDDHHILATKQDSTHLVYCHNSMDNVNTQCATLTAKLCKQHKIYKVSIIAPNIEPAVYTVFHYCHINTKHINIASLYNQLQHANMLPALHPTSTKTKGIVASYALSKHRAKHYAISSIFLVVISSISYLPAYTLAWATVLLALALYSRFNTRYNSKISPNLEL